MSKFSKKRKAASAAAIAATEDVYDSHPFPNLDTELKSLQLKTKQISTQDSEQVLLANAPPKPYVRQKEEVLNDFLCCLALAPKQNGRISSRQVSFSSRMAKLPAYPTSSPCALAPNSPKNCNRIPRSY